MSGRDSELAWEDPWFKAAAKYVCKSCGENKAPGNLCANCANTKYIKPSWREVLWKSVLDKKEEVKMLPEDYILDAYGNAIEEGYPVILVPDHDGAPYRLVEWDLDPKEDEDQIYCGTAYVERPGSSRESFPLYVQDGQACTPDLAEYTGPTITEEAEEEIYAAFDERARFDEKLYGVKTEKRRIRNYKAMSDQKLSRSLRELMTRKGEAYKRCLEGGSGDPEGDLQVCMIEAKNRGLL